jgi:hypothetical protein
MTCLYTKFHIIVMIIIIIIIIIAIITNHHHHHHQTKNKRGHGFLAAFTLLFYVLQTIVRIVLFSKVYK